MGFRFSLFPKDDKFYSLLRTSWGEVYDSAVCFKDFISSRNPTVFKRGVAYSGCA